VSNLHTGDISGVITQPFHIVKIPVSDKEIVFEQVAHVIENDTVIVPVSEISFAEFGCDWNVIYPYKYDTLIVINSDEELIESYEEFFCTNFPKIDFSK
jgi:hypothetical protein